MLLRRRHFFKRISLIAAKLFLVLFILIFVVIPLIFKYSYKFQSSLIFLNFVRVPRYSQYDHPENFGLANARNFYVDTDDGMRLGVWHILPDNLDVPGNTDGQQFEEILGNGQDVVVYMHGNAGTRLTEHRIQLYKVLKQFFHVIAFDYRSYADSTKDTPSELKLVSDCLFMYKWVANRTNGNIYVWGHSLGTGLALHTLSVLDQSVAQPKGLILEAPFNNMREEIVENPIALAFKYLPWFHYTVVEPIMESGLTFESDKYICRIDTPILILHAEDDHVIPIKLGRKLYEEAMLCRKNMRGQIFFHQFERKHKYEHKYICRAPELPSILSDFIKATKESEM